MLVNQHSLFCVLANKLQFFCKSQISKLCLLYIFEKVLDRILQTQTTDMKVVCYESYKCLIEKLQTEAVSLVV